ncbi:unconventional myosin-XVIIIa [Eurytemora carolleeae]|uniref:unconventional myosin-XVIIIa n=1 Tax=Eurytemora carolleeae TaxID=1294199 RepID=UPI000C783CB2|nr:unconventional myosin-XVIIIa [Eurytemora carolleeae]|eukprot:XP_023333583.1 unconventional myosin-XVIIIa-like [Eurytemora affinis]
MFKGCKIEDMPPHIYSVAQSAYRALLTTKKDQSVALLGRAGSGKSTNFRHVVSYLALAGGESSILSLDKLSGIHTILEAFGNSRTLLNANATRFSQIFSVHYDHSGSIVSGSIQVLMLERNRVVRRPEGEPNFNVFYQLLAGLDNNLRRV